MKTADNSAEDINEYQEALSSLTRDGDTRRGNSNKHYKLL